MEIKELLKKAKAREIKHPDDLQLYLDTVRLSEDFEEQKPHLERIYDIAVKKKVENAVKHQRLAIKYYEIAKKAALMLAPHLFHYYLLYVEWDREPQKKFYVPRMKVLRVVVDDLQDLADGKLDLLTISLPPRVGKSTLGIFFMTWLMGRDPAKANVMSGHSDKLTKGFYKEALDIISSPDYLWHDVFPKSQIANTSAEDESIDIDKKRRFPTLTCRSISGTLTGAVEVGNLLYVDDIIEDLEEALNPLRLQNKYDAYLNQLKDRKKDGAKELHIGTRWAVSDVIGRLQEQYGDNPRARFRVIPALNEKGESNFDYAYGLGFSTQYYQDMKASIDPCTWACKYMGDPYVREGLLFERDDLRYYNGTLPDGVCDIASAVDVAWGGGDSLSAPIIYWFGDTGYVHDWVFSTGDKSVTQPLVVSAFSKNQVAKARFEANVGGHEYAEEIDGALKNIGYKMNVQSARASTKSSKMDKIIRWSNDIKTKLVFRNDKGRGEMYDKAMAELCRFSVDAKKQHDDAPDSLSMCLDFRFNGLSTVQIIERRW